MKPALALLLVLLAASIAAGQAIPASESPGPRYELFGGFARMRADIGTDRRPNGWNTAATVYLNKWIGMDANLGGGYATASDGRPTSLHWLLFGPRLSFPVKMVRPFIHASVGLARWRLGGFNVGTGTDTDIAKGGGLGVDVRINDRIALRLLQADYLNTRFLGHDNAVFSTGIVFGIGQR